MKTYITPLIELLKKKTFFWVPLYQRNFSWKQNQFLELLNDLKGLIGLDSSENEKTHYFGPVVLLKKDPSISAAKATGSFEIIDGQQRITTIIVFLRVLAEHFSNLREDIFIVLYPNSKKSSKKLTLHSADERDLDIIMETASGGKVSNSSFKECWSILNDFVTREKKANADFGSDIIRALGKLVVAIIEVGSEDDPQTIFDRINTAGIPLTSYEKIKNYLFLKFDYDGQRIIDDYCRSLEKSLGSRNDTNKYNQFLKYFYTANYSSYIKGDIYSAYHQKMVTMTDDEILDFANLLTQYAFIFGRHIVVNQNFDDQTIGRSFLYRSLPKELKYLLIHYRMFQLNAMYPFVLKELYALYSNTAGEIEVMTSLYRGFNQALSLYYSEASSLDYSRLCLASARKNDGEIPHNCKYPNLDKEFHNRRRDMLFLDYFGSWADEETKERINRFRFLITKSPVGVWIEDELKGEAETMLADYDTDLIPKPVGISIDIDRMIKDNAHKATNKRPFNALILGHSLQAYTWKDLKIEALKIALEEEPDFVIRILNNKNIKTPKPFSSYYYISTNPDYFNEESIMYECGGQTYYINGSSQSAADIMWVLSDFCKRPGSYVECV